MIKVHSVLILVTLISLAYACAPSMSRTHGLCEYYVDGTSDTETTSSSDSGSSDESGSDESGESKKRKKRDTDSESGESDSDSSSSSSTTTTTKTKYTRTKLKKEVQCYKYEDGSKDEGAVLEDGVEDITITVTTE